MLLSNSSEQFLSYPGEQISNKPVIRYKYAAKFFKYLFVILKAIKN